MFHNFSHSPIYKLYLCYLYWYKGNWNWLNICPGWNKMVSLHRRCSSLPLLPSAGLELHQYNGFTAQKVFKFAIIALYGPRSHKFSHLLETQLESIPKLYWLKSSSCCTGIFQSYSTDQLLYRLLREQQPDDICWWPAAAGYKNHADILNDNYYLTYGVFFSPYCPLARNCKCHTGLLCSTGKQQNPPKLGNSLKLEALLQG